MDDHEVPPVSADDQLAAIGSLAAALDGSETDYWLFGGWAVDFWVGEVTRTHDDIDVVVWRQDDRRIHSSLLAAGWEHTPTPDDLVGTRYRSGAVEVELTFVERGAAGEVVVPLPTGPVVWAAQPFGDERARLRGVASRVIPLDVLLAGKSVAREGPVEAAKDQADFEALSRAADHG